jgi:CRP-like cAMP-binding protein
LDDPEALSKNDWDQLLTAAKLISYEKHQSIVVEGEHIQRIYQIVSGTCRIEKNGTEKPLGTVEPGATLGGNSKYANQDIN